MRPGKFAAATLLALAVAVPTLPAVSASAAPATHHSASAHVAKDHAKKAKKAKKARKEFAKFNLGGTLTAVDAAAGTVTFTVHGGKEKALRGQSLTVVLGENARVLRNDGPATLADFVVGDKVRAKGKKAGGVYTASRVKAVAPDLDDDAPETPAPLPEPQPEPEPTD